MRKCQWGPNSQKARSHARAPSPQKMGGAAKPDKREQRVSQGECGLRVAASGQAARRPSGLNVAKVLRLARHSTLRIH